MRVILGLLLVVGLSGGLTGCTTATIATAGQEETDPRVVYKERNFETRLQVLDLKTRRVGDVLQVSATLRNRWDARLRFAYQFRFFDKDGFPVGNESLGWLPIYMVGEDVKDVTAMAPNASADSFKLVISTQFVPD